MSDIVELPQTDALASSGESPECPEGLRSLLGPFEEGETYARGILGQQWFRGFSALKSQSNLEEAGMMMLKKHGFGAENPGEGNGGGEGDGEECGEEDEGSRQRVRTAAEKFVQDRQRGEFFYQESTARGALEQEEFECISQMQIIMQEDLARLAEEEESMVMLRLVQDVMRPKLRQQYIFAWGLVTAVAPPPLWNEVDRIRCSQRHKPEYMRVPPLTCRVPIEPNPFWEPWEPVTPKHCLIRMRSDMGAK